MAKQIVVTTHPNADFFSSHVWFKQFKAQFRTSKRRATNTCQKEPEDKRSAIQHFHQSIGRAVNVGEQLCPLGRWSASTIGNMNRTPLPFIFSSGETYADTGERYMWVCGNASGLDKQQCTVQLTLFADSEPRVTPLLIFQGTGKRMAFAELCYIYCQEDHSEISAKSMMQHDEVLASTPMEANL